jgi:hypothetical protein
MGEKSHLADARGEAKDAGFVELAEDCGLFDRVGGANLGGIHCKCGFHVRVS